MDNCKKIDSPSSPSSPICEGLDHFDNNNPNDSTLNHKKGRKNYFSSEPRPVQQLSTNNSQIIAKGDTEAQGISESDLKKISLPSAIIWNFFTRIDKISAKCNICNTRRSTPTSTTTTLKNHLKKHSNAYQEYIRLTTIKENVTKKRKTTDQVSESSKKSLQSFIKNAVTFDPSCKRAKEITKAYLFARDCNLSVLLKKKDSSIYYMFLSRGITFPAEVLYRAPSSLTCTKFYKTTF